MSKVMNQILKCIAQESYKSAEHSANKVSSKGVYQFVEPNELKKLKKVH